MTDTDSHVVDPPGCTRARQLRALLATPLLELDIEKAKDTIEEAEEANVMPSLIDKAVEHTENAAEAQLSAMGDDLL